MKKLAEYINNQYICLKGLDKNIVEKLSNLEGYEITECCGCCDDSCSYGCDIPGEASYTVDPSVPVSTGSCTTLEPDPITKYTNIFSGYPKVMDLYNAHGEFSYKCRFNDEYQRSNSEPLVFYEPSSNMGNMSMSPKLREDILSICKDQELSNPVLLLRANGDIQLFAIKHMGTNGKECSIKNSLLDAADTLTKLEKRKEITWAQVLDVAIDNLDDLYTFLFTVVFEKEKYEKDLETRANKNEFPHPINNLGKKL